MGVHYATYSVLSGGVLVVKQSKPIDALESHSLDQGCATFFTGGPLSKILTTSRASHRQICIKL